VRYAFTLMQHYKNPHIYSLLDEILPHINERGEYKCRFLYNAKNYAIELQKYDRRKIVSLKVIHTAAETNYDFKTIVRKKLDDLFALRDSCDEIIIVKNGLVTDAYYYNLVFEKQGKYYTPKQPLLKGVMRSALLQENCIIPMDIRVEDIYNFEKIHLINALNPLGYLEVGVRDIAM
jgi:4-amino-4-deoxychorismate lyase